MIQGIPNQPIDFVGDDLIACAPEAVAPLVVAQEDSFIFQVGLSHCEGAEEFVVSPSFVAGWRTSGLWTINVNNACADNEQEGASIEYELTPVDGTTYEVVIVVTSIGGSGILVSIGGTETIIASTGEHAFLFVAENDDPLNISLIDDSSSVCL
ncbi:MAG: hypothetical protein E6Q97_32325, partial [Desulfurellales bacterium]